MLGAVFGDKYSWEDYGSIMNYARITPPVPKTNYVDIAGGNSALDLTEALGGIVYEDGDIEFKFTLFSLSDLSKMKNDIHGKRGKIVLQREADYYYDGRTTCTKQVQEGRIYELYFTARVYPYKYERFESVYVESVTGQDKEVILQNASMPVMPKIKVDGNIYLIFEGVRYSMGMGEYQHPDIILQEGDNRIRLSGNGTVKFIYRKGRLI